MNLGNCPACGDVQGDLQIEYRPDDIYICACELTCTFAQWAALCEMRAKAQAFDAVLAKVQTRNVAGAYFPMEPSDMLEALAEAKRKGEGP